MKKSVIFIISLIIIVLSFGIVSAQDDMSMLRTEIASTVIAEIKQTFEADGYEITLKGQATEVPSTNSGITGGFVWGTWKPTPTYYSYAAQLVKQDKNYMHMAHDVQFTVNWTIRNTGPLPWTKDFYFRYVMGQEALDNSNYFPGVVERGDSITFSRSFEAKMEPGIYNSYWELVDNNGTVILDNIWVGWQVDDWRQ